MFSPSELGIINLSIQTKEDRSARQFGLSELPTAIAIFGEIKKAVVNDSFVESDIEFTAEQKVFISKLIKERNWSVAEGETVMNLIEKIK